MKAFLAFNSACLAFFVTASVLAAEPKFSALPALPESFASSTTNSQLNTNAFSTMDTLDDKHKLALGDRLSFRVVEDQKDPRENPLDPKPPFLVTDSGDVEVPYIGRFPAAGKTCKQLAQELKVELERQYYFKATVIIALDQVSKSTGRVYVLGEVRLTGPVDMPGDETLTVGKAILRAGGFTNYADKRRVKVTRKSEARGRKSQTFVVNVAEILERGKTDKDLNLEPGDIIFVPSRLINF